MKTAHKWRKVPMLVVMCAFMIMTGTAYSQAQCVEQKVFDAVPEPLRARLVERLNLYVEAQRARQYEKVYDLLSESARTRMYKNQSRADFVKSYQDADAAHRGTRLNEFTPSESDKIEEEDHQAVYEIYGKAKLQQEGETVSKRIVIQAELQNGEWYFYPMAEVLID
jgi:hypothetical protein